MAKSWLLLKLMGTKSKLKRAQFDLCTQLTQSDRRTDLTNVESVYSEHHTEKDI